MSTPDTEHRRREGYRVILSPGLWRGFDVEIEPPTSTHALRHFADRAQAVEWAENIQRLEGWPITDKTGKASRTG